MAHGTEAEQWYNPRMNQPHSAAQRRATTLFMFVLVAGAAIYTVLAWHYRLVPTLPKLRAQVGSLSKGSWTAATYLALAGIALHGLYVLGGLICWRIVPTQRVIYAVWFGAAAVAVILISIYPVTSTDIFDYLFRGRIAAHYGQNPYIALPNQFKKDPLFATIGWPNAPSAYGPLWEMLSQALAMVGGASLLLNVLLHKTVGVLTYLLCGGAIWRITRASGRHMQLLGSYLWLWSPLTIWEILAAGHNDGLLILSVLLGIWACERGYTRWAVLALTVGTLLKFLPVILLPLVVVYGMRSLTTWRARLRLLAESVVLFGVVTVLAYWPYWAGPQTLHNIAVREEFATSAPLAVLSYGLREAGVLQWINATLQALGLPHPANGHDVMAAVSRSGSALLALGLTWQLWQIWRNGRGIARAVFGLLLWYLVLGSQWFQPWYVLWLLGLLALRPERRTWAWISVWALAGQASYLLQFFGQPYLFRQLGATWGGQRFATQALYGIIIFLPPLLVWGIGWLWSRRRRSRATALETSTQMETAWEAGR